MKKERYTFHDLRRAFATANAGNLDAATLQHVMQHKDYATTLKYINAAKAARSYRIADPVLSDEQGKPEMKNA